MKKSGLCVLGVVAALLLAGCGPGASSNTQSAAGGGIDTQKVYRWKLITTWPKNLPGLGMAPERMADNLRITEIMYHPQDTGDPNDPYAEFIELQNVGTEMLNLNLVRFTKGIDFTFPDIDLAAGEYVVVVKDLQVFAARYGIDIPVVGQYSGSLANGGERIRLEDAVGQTILDFEYSDNWYKDTDGRGYSLTIVDAANPDPNSWSLKQSWQVSASRGGSPG